MSLTFSLSLSLTHSWDSQFHALVEFRRTNGHCNVPFSYEAICNDGRKVMTHRLTDSQTHHLKSPLKFDAN